jgi:hypothetical protein
MCLRAALLGMYTLHQKTTTSFVAPRTPMMNVARELSKLALRLTRFPMKAKVAASFVAISLAVAHHITQVLIAKILTTPLGTLNDLLTKFLDLITIFTVPQKLTQPQLQHNRALRIINHLSMNPVMRLILLFRILCHILITIFLIFPIFLGSVASRLRNFKPIKLLILFLVTTAILTDAMDMGGGLAKRPAPTSSAASAAKAPNLGAALGWNSPIGVPKELNLLVAILCKLTLSNTLQIRILKAVVLLPFMMPTASTLIQKVKAATLAQSHAINTTKEALTATTEPKLLHSAAVRTVGHAHVWAWNAILEHCRSQWEVDAPYANPDAMQISTLYLESIQKDAEWRQTLTKYVKICRVEKSGTPQEKKLIFNVDVTHAAAGPHVQQMFEHVKNLIVATKGCRALEGVAPPGAMEKVIQSWLVENGHSSATPLGPFGGD